MKKTVFLLLIGLALGAAFSGCERNDYQHPMHRNN
jgi:heme/copper-type cytochrome/quinol oxidase subunit 3